MTRRENYKSDLRLAVTLTLGGAAIPVPQHDFMLRFTTTGSRRYDCTYKNGVWSRCREEDGKVLCFLDNHHLGMGVLHVEYYDYAPDADFVDGNQLKVVPRALDVELIAGAGDDSEEIDVEVVTDIVGALADVAGATARANAIAADLEDKRESDYYRGAQGEKGDKGDKGDPGSAADLTGYYTSTQVDALLSGKQAVLTFDDTPTSESANPVKSGGVYTALAGKQASLTFDTAPTSDSTNPVTSGGVYTALAGKQSTISDLDTIRSGAAAGATALQSGDLSDWAKASSKPSYSYSEISGTPSLAAVATSGAYSDLSGAPSVTDNLTSTSSTNALSANQGKVLKGLLDCYCPIVEDTRASAVAAITGVAPFASLVGGQRVLLRLKYGMSNYSTLNLTLSTGDATGAKTMWSSSTYNSKSDAFGGINAGSCYEFVYDATEDKWIMVGQRDTNTTYLNVTNDNIANSAVGINTINGKILRDNFYLKSETDTLLAAKASTSDLAAKADVVAKVVLEVWYTDAELTYWSGTDAFTRQELEAALDNYYEGWDDDEDNVDIVDTIMTSPASPVEIERMSKKMAGALNTISDEFDIEDKGGFSVTATAEQSNIPSVPMKLVTFDASVSYTASDLADAIDTLTGSTSWRNATDLAAVEVIAASCPNDVDVVMTDEFAGVLDECAADEGFFEDFGGILVSSSTYECYQISPNTFYDFGTQNKLYLDFVAGTPGVVNIYAFRFKFNASSSQLNLPASVEWLDDAPEAAAGRRVEVSVMDNLGVFTAKDLEE